MHGIALVIHRAWQQLGFRMHTFLAWFITFNFINIAWVFFRAKEFDDAIKILKGMSGISGVTLPHVLSSKFFFLHQYGVEFGNFIGNIGGNSYTIIWVVFGLLIVFGLKNSMELLQNFKVSNITVWFSGILFIVAILSMNKISEFLYFNF